MAKKKVDQVIEYRISLQDKQSEQLDSMIAAYQVNKIGTPLVALLSDGSAMLIIAGLLEAYGITDIIPNDIIQQIKDGVYDQFGPAMEAVEFAVDIVDPREAGERAGKKVAASPIVKAWVWLLTSGRVLTAQIKE